MSQICGLIRRDGAPAGRSLSSMLTTLVGSGPDGPDGTGTWSDGCAGLAQARTFSTPESGLETLPAYDQVASFVFTAAGRLDNRNTLIAELGLRERSHARPGLGDGELIMAAYRRWGEGSPVHLFGDWSFAAWHPAERRLFLARDHHGQTAIYYHADRNVFAFASNAAAVLSLGLAPIVLEELYLAQYLTSWPAYQGERTGRPPLRQLPPAHTLTLTPDRLDLNRYWWPEHQPELRLRNRSDYVDALREVFGEAVRTRMRSSGGVAVMLSGGLDSGAVASTAARIAGERGDLIRAFTSVPIVHPAAYAGTSLGQELPLARAIAEAAGNIDITQVTAEQLSPVEAIRSTLRKCGFPVHAAANLFWIIDLYRLARESGCPVLLTGALGNPTISWHGSVLSQPLVHQLRRLGPGQWTRMRIRDALPTGLRIELARRRADPEWYRSSAIHPDLARRLELAERRRADPDTFPRTPRRQRLALIMPGRSTLGAVTAGMAAAHGLDVRDPTGDVRVIEFTLSVPDSIFRDPNDHSRGRWLIREAMRGRLPDQVRLNRRHGLQAADLIARLRNTAAEVDGALDELAAGPAADYVDVDHMRATWRRIQREDTPQAFRQAVSIVTRGIMGGLHANAVARGEALSAPAPGQN